MAFKVVLQEKLLKWSLQDTIKQPIIVFLGHTQSNHQNIFAHYLRVNLKTAKMTLPFKDYLSMFIQEDSKCLIGMTQQRLQLYFFSTKGFFSTKTNMLVMDIHLRYI